MSAMACGYFPPFSTRSPQSSTGFAQGRRRDSFHVQLLRYKGQGEANIEGATTSEFIAMQTVKFKAGDTILSEGDDGDSAFLIISGSVEVSIGAGARAKGVGTLVAGDVFGEMGLMEPGPRSATVKAVTETECFV